MSVALNDYFQFAIEYTQYNQRMMFTHAYRVSNADDGTISENAASVAFLSQIGVGDPADMLTAFRELLPASCVINRTRFQKVWPVRYRYYYEDMSLAGVHSAGAQYTNLAAVITLTSRLAGRSEVANKHIGPVPYEPDTIQEGVIQPDYKALLETFGGHLLGPIAGGIGTLEFQPIILHRVLDEDGHVVGYTSTDVFQQTISLVVGTMRRRTVGRGI